MLEKCSKVDRYVGRPGTWSFPETPYLSCEPPGRKTAAAVTRRWREVDMAVGMLVAFRAAVAMEFIKKKK